MSWNIGIMCVKASLDYIDEIIPDIFYKSSSDNYFEDVSSYSIGTGLGVTESDGWIIIVDPNWRFIDDERYPLEVSQKFQVKTLYISEKIVYRDYEDNKKSREIKGLRQAKKYLKQLGIKPIDKYGETMAFQILENDIFNLKKEGHSNSLMDKRFEIYELD